jgi:hypothetical protein
VEVLQRFDLSGAVVPFRRCLSCNGLLQPVRKEDISDRLPPKTKQYYDEFHACRACGRVYWKGSHYRRMQQLIERVLAREQPAQLQSVPPTRSEEPSTPG